MCSSTEAEGPRSVSFCIGTPRYFSDGEGSCRDFRVGWKSPGFLTRLRRNSDLPESCEGDGSREGGGGNGDTDDGGFLWRIR